MATISRRHLGMVGATAMLAPATRAATEASAATVRLPRGDRVPALGQGLARLGQGRRQAAEEEAALRTGLSLGMTLIDTAEMYGGGASEELIGRVVRDRRSDVFIVSKVLPNNATEAGMRSACAASLNRLGTDYLDLYLLHWRDAAADLRVVVSTFEALRAEGRIRRWGVSNFKLGDMRQLFDLPGGTDCATNQILYNLAERRAERDVIPWCREHGVPIMAYTPLGSGGTLLQHPSVARIAARHGVTPAAVALAWAVRDGRTVAIPESGSVTHVRENAAALGLSLDRQDLAELDQAFPG